jgi:hypothetical protein
MEETVFPIIIIFMVALGVVALGIVFWSILLQKKAVVLQKKAMDDQRRAIDQVDESLAFVRQSIENQERVIALLAEIRDEMRKGS